MRSGIQLLIRYFRLFRGYAGRRLYLVIALTLAMSYAEGIGIAFFFPLLDQGNHGTSSASSTLTPLFHRLHIPLTPVGVLPLILVFFLVKGALQFATTTLQYFSGTAIVRMLRARLVDGLSAADYLYVMRGNTGRFTNLVNNEVNRSASGFLYYVRSMPPGMNVVVFLGLATCLDWRLTLACIGVGMIMVIMLRFAGRLAAHYSTLTVAESSTLTHLLIQGLHAFKYLRATAGAARFNPQIDRSADRLAHYDYRNGAALSLTQSMAQPVIVTFMVAIIYYRTAIRGETLASLFVILIYFFRTGTELFTLQTNWQTFCAYLGSIDAVEAATLELTNQREPRGNHPAAGWNGELVCDAVSFAYAPGREVLRDISLRVSKGSTVAFVGESGSGKSTLVDVLTGTLRPSAGQVRIDERALAEVDLEALRRRTGYVPQDSIMFDDTVANNITLWSTPDVGRLTAVARRARCLDFVEALPQGFASPIGDRGVRLSGGQRQRLAIARELYKDPELLILDEATSALDSESEHAIQQSIQELKGQMTILIVAHRLSTIRSSDFVYVLHEGRIVEEGSYDELLARPNSRFRRMCELQNLAEATA